MHEADDLHLFDQHLANEEEGNSEKEHEKEGALLSTRVVLLRDLDILILDVSWVWRAFDMELMGSKFERFFLLRSLGCMSSVEDDPHVVGRGKLIQLLILDGCHLGLDLGELNEVSILEGLSSCFQLLVQLRVVETEVNVNDIKRIWGLIVGVFGHELTLDSL